MIHPCRLIYPYYNNPGMLERQVENWSRFEGDLREAVRIIVVDDHSGTPPVDILKACKAPVRCYRLLKKWPWNMHEARNIGAKEACKEAENFWLFMSDIDIVLTPEMAYTMLTKDLDPGAFYTMERTFAPSFTERKAHPNTFLVKRNAFWAVNGYNIDLNPVGGGGYGGDNQFVRQLRGVVEQKHLDDVVLVGYGRRERGGKPIVKDADTSDYDRAEWAEKYVEKLTRLKRKGDLRSKNPIRTSYERLL